MNNGFNTFKAEALSIVDQIPDLTYREVDQGIPELVGLLSLTDPQGILIDSYKIRIVCPSSYPLQFPLVYETGGKIPTNIDWHVFSDGHACVCSIPEEIIASHKGITLEIFIQHWVTPYFFNQKYREMHGFFLNERAHGLQGNIDFFIGVFKTKKVSQIIEGLLFIKNNPEPNRVHNCFCGSGVKFRNCHRDTFRLFKPLTEGILNWFIKILMSHC